MSVSAIIGGGISGLACSQRLKQLGQNSVVFDTGKHTAGGRTSSRHIEINKETCIFDHSAQCFTVETDQFQTVVDGWLKAGIVRQWPSEVLGTLSQKAGFVPRHVDDPPMYIGVKGMRSIVEHLVKGINVRQPVWISDMNRTDDGQKWELFEFKTRHGEFDSVIISHNGKCADRLTKPNQSIKQINRLLRVKFQPQATEQPMMQLCSLWVLMVAFPSSLELPFEGAFVEGEEELTWVANNTKKLQQNHKVECWTLISGRKFASDNKVPQEHIPKAKAREVTEKMLECFSRVTKLTLPKEVYSRVQLWGAAVPMNTYQHPCVWDAREQVGICGDWLVKPSIEGAFNSGVSMAEQLYKHNTQTNQRRSVGLRGQFQIVGGPPIGDFSLIR
eukprot:TRINITY_DN5661_c0_g1_i5.p1 TRINITY_DN5661_c0_g1~~TRINITY_DN5661_c0_g1_i5.p1  ORF type:complete len:388 (-),score=44.12 TRINITY_DN5661_c0_g1_i5:269-1432(-)